MPYHKAGESSTDVLLDDTAGKFGPFAGQLFVGDFRSALMTRVFLEKVGGEYQGAVFPFRHGFASAVVRMCFGQDGGMFVGLTNRGWTSVGAASYVNPRFAGLKPNARLRDLSPARTRCR